jgi:PDDEXK-like domain of unknown function (DUF3799)
VTRIVHDLDELTYHADPALSSSGARAILRSPAKFDHDRTHGRPERRVFDFGHAAHGLVLGVGQPVVLVDAADWRSKASQTARDEAYAAGSVPLLLREYAVVQAMAAGIRAHPVASRLLSGEGRPEVSMFWRDESTGVDCRARADWLRYPPDGTPVIVDYKTAVDASPRGFARSAAEHGYHQQDAWYRSGVGACMSIDAPFVFVAQEKTAPYLVACYQLDDEAVTAGARRNRAALELFAECTATGVWPGHSETIETIGLPRWAVNTYTEDM